MSVVLITCLQRKMFCAMYQDLIYIDYSIVRTSRRKRLRVQEIQKKFSLIEMVLHSWMLSTIWEITWPYSQNSWIRMKKFSSSKSLTIGESHHTQEEEDLSQLHMYIMKTIHVSTQNQNILHHLLNHQCKCHLSNNSISRNKSQCIINLCNHNCINSISKEEKVLHQDNHKLKVKQTTHMRVMSKDMKSIKRIPMVLHWELLRKNGMSLGHWDLKILLPILQSTLTSPWSSVRASTINTSLDNSLHLERLLVSVKKLTTSFMKVCSEMILITATDDSFILMEIITSDNG